MECVGTFNYLCSIVTTIGGAGEDIEARIDMTKATLGLV